MSNAFRLTIATSWLAPDAWRDQQEQAIRQGVDGGMDWAEYLRLVDRHRTPALSWAALKRVQGLDVPEFASRELKKRSDACRMQAVGHAQLLAAVLKGFNRAQIPAMPLKGPLLSLELYGDLGLRQSKDLDIMVVGEDIPRAEALLKELGWRAEAENFPLTPRQWKACMRNGKHIDFVHAQRGCCLELHWRNLWDMPGQTEDLWARSVAATWQGCCYQSMNPIDQVLYLCSHGSEHGWTRAKWLGDLACLHFKRNVDWETALKETSKTDRQMPLLLCRRLLKDMHGIPLPLLPAERTRRLPSFLVGNAVNDLEDDEEHESRGILAGIRERTLRTRWRWPYRSLRTHCNHHHSDRRVFRPIRGSGECAQPGWRHLRLDGDRRRHHLRPGNGSGSVHGRHRESCHALLRCYQQSWHSRSRRPGSDGQSDALNRESLTRPKRCGGRAGCFLGIRFSRRHAELSVVSEWHNPGGNKFPHSDHSECGTGQCRQLLGACHQHPRRNHHFVGQRRGNALCERAHRRSPAT